MTDLAAATAAMVGATSHLVNTKAEVLNWAAGTVDGGPDGDGNYPFTAADGTVISVPTPAKIAAMNGDPTAAAATLDAKVAAVTNAAKTATDAAAGIINPHFAIDILATATIAVVPANGSTAIDDAGGHPIGLSIPTGRTGQSSELYVSLPLDASKHAGEKLRFIVSLDVGATYTRNPYAVLQSSPGDGNWYAAPTTADALSAPANGEIVWTIEHVCDGGERSFRLALVPVGTDATASDEHLTVTGLWLEWLTSANPALTPLGMNAAELRARIGVDTAAQVATAEATLRGEIATDIAAAIAPAQLSTGNLLASARSKTQLLSGATGLGAWGAVIPASNAGAQAVLQPVVPIDGAGNAGATIRAVMGVTVSAAWARGFVPAFQVQTVAGMVVRTADVAASTTGARRVWTYSYALQGDELAIAPFLVTAAGAAAQADTITLTDVGYSFTAAAGLAQSAADETIGARLYPITNYVQRAKDRANQRYEAAVLVRPDGTGDFTHPKLALDAIGDASSGKRYAVLIEPGTYSQYAEWHTKDYIDLVAIGRRQDTVLTYELPDSATADQINNTSTLWLDSRTRLIGLTVSVANGRYAIHRETNGLKVGNKSAIIDCWVQHLGNTSPNNNWASRYGVGAGNSPGEVYDDERSVFVGIDGGFSYHQPNNANYMQATLARFRDCMFSASGGAAASNGAGARDLFVKVLRPGAGDACVLDGCSLTTLSYYDPEWQLAGDTTTPRNTIRVISRGCTPFTWYNTITAAPGGAYQPEYLALAA